MHSGAKRLLFAAIILAGVVSLFAKSFNRYYLGVAIDVGINVILAVSLNLINGWSPVVCSPPWLASPSEFLLCACAAITWLS